MELVRNNKFCIEQRILNLVLYNHSVPHERQMYEILSKFYKTFPHVKTVFYTYDSTLETDCKELGDILFFRGKESLVPGVLDKTLLAFNHFDLSQYDYVIRPNISTVVHLDKYVDLLTPDMKYAGTHIASIAWIDKKSGVGLKHQGIKYVQGTCLTFSSSFLVKIIANPNIIDRKLVDDVSIGKLAAHFAEHPVYNVNQETNPNIKAIVYRNKHKNRQIDVRNMQIEVCN